MPDTETVYVTFDDGASFESILVTPLSSDTFRLEETPLSEEGLSFGDVIRVEKVETGQHKFVQVVSKAEYQSYRWLLSQRVVESLEFKAFCETIMRAGGMWERALGGLVIVHIPPGEDLEPEVEIEKIISRLSKNT